MEVIRQNASHCVTIEDAVTRQVPRRQHIERIASQIFPEPTGRRAHEALLLVRQDRLWQELRQPLSQHVLLPKHPDLHLGGDRRAELE